VRQRSGAARAAQVVEGLRKGLAPHKLAPRAEVCAQLMLTVAVDASAMIV